jgi:hypothetical protein
MWPILRLEFLQQTLRRRRVRGQGVQRAKIPTVAARLKILEQGIGDLVLGPRPSNNVEIIAVSASVTHQSKQSKPVTAKKVLVCQREAC